MATYQSNPRLTESSSSVYSRHIALAYPITSRISEYVTLGSVVTFRELLGWVEKQMGKPVRPIFVPLNFGVWLATLLETVLGQHSPVRREQILRLQEDKAYSHEAAQRDLDFFPRSLEVGLQQEVELLRSQEII